MKSKDKLPDLTKTEFDILRILWKAGKLSIREVHDQMVENYSWAYSTTKTTMNRMAEKGLLKKEKFHGVFLYKPLIARAKGFARLINFFSNRVLELDYRDVVALFSRSNALTAEEAEELAQLLDEDEVKEK